MNRKEEPMPATRIDFKYVREHADFAKVLGAYSIELHKDGSRPGQFKCLCPFHDDRNPSMKVNTQKNIFNCFVCDEGHGNVLDFVMKMDAVEIREAAKTVADLSGIAYSATASTAKPKAKAGKPNVKRAATTQAKPPSTEVPAVEVELDSTPPTGSLPSN
jgi:DNA primase